jgi:hypothetical protein
VLSRPAARPAPAAAQLADLAARFGSVQARVYLARLHAERGDAAAALDDLGRARRFAPSSE